MDKNLLRSHMAKHGDTGQMLADALGITNTTLSYKMNQKRSDFTVGEIVGIKTRYNLTAEEIDEIFFANAVSQKDTEVSSNDGGTGE